MVVARTVEAHIFTIDYTGIRPLAHTSSKTLSPTCRRLSLAEVDVYR